MIIAQKVKQAVNQEKIKLIIKVKIPLSGIFKGLFSGNHDIAENLRVDMTEISFLQGKGDDVGRIIPPEILLVWRTRRRSSFTFFCLFSISGFIVMDWFHVDLPDMRHGVIDPLMENTGENPCKCFRDTIQITQGQFTFVQLTVHKNPFNSFFDEISDP